MIQKIEPRCYLSAIIRRWPILFLMGLLGGLIGYGLSFRYPAIYQSVAVMAVGLDFDRDPPITVREQDYAEGKVVAFVQSDELLQKTLDILNQDLVIREEIPSLEEFQKITTIHRVFSLWQLQVNHTDPVLSTDLCNTWANVAYEALWEAFSHALRANSLEIELEKIQIQLGFSNWTSGSDNGIPDEIRDLEKRALELEEQIEREIKLSHGVVSFMSFELENKATVPLKPVTRAMNNLILAGSLIGVIAGILVGITWETVHDKDGRKLTPSKGGIDSR